MDKYRPCPSTIAMFTSDSQHPPRSKHAVYLGDLRNQNNCHSDSKDASCQVTSEHFANHQNDINVSKFQILMF